LRQELASAEGQPNGVVDYSPEMARMQIELTQYRSELEQYRDYVAALEAQLEELGYASSEQYEPYQEESYVPGDGRPHYDYTPDPDPPTVEPQPEYTIHVVQAGQFMSHIARMHFGSNSQFYIDLIVAANDDITDPGRIREGQEIIIPPRP
ncbi:MAG: LysM peptidoglycan-binding domain-containing protein, partial [Defluviitaleaceae bacterium]|nr:LysM peptidoglycan-binding domain-containing protein [Defluviitaleaceae bacterium]